ncbi:MAG: sucrase ferredoxin [SAR324 cluster bacterium]|nr:sucrase ferredoxin [SAR324 cluster bacterium]
METTSFSHDVFCTDKALALKEPLAGTAPHAKMFVFISWPKAQWGYDALDTPAIPEKLAPWLEAQEKRLQGKVQLRLISQSRTSPEQHTVMIFPDSRQYRNVPRDSLMEVLENHVGGTPLKEFPPAPVDNLQIFVCTHGRHDKCCARYGQKIYQSLRNEIAHPDIDVWESSHLGGHRFAATAMVFPQADVYGWLTGENVSTWVTMLLQNRVYGPAYRGNAWLNDISQIADAYARQFCYEQGFDARPVLRQTRMENENLICDIELTSPTTNPVKSLTLSLIRKTFESPISCDNPPELRNRWILQLVETHDSVASE